MDGNLFIALLVILGVVILVVHIVLICHFIVMCQSVKRIADKLDSQDVEETLKNRKARKWGTNAQNWIILMIILIVIVVMCLLISR